MSIDIHVAAKNGDVAAIAEYIRNGGNLDVQDHQGNRPLHLASRHGQEESVAALLGAGVDPSAVNSTGQTSLVFAEENGHHGCASLIQGKPLRTLRTGSMTCGIHGASLEKASGDNSSDKWHHGEDEARWDENKRQHECRTEGTAATGSSSEDTTEGGEAGEAGEAGGAGGAGGASGASGASFTKMAGAEEHAAYADNPHNQQGSAWHLYYDEASQAYYYYDYFSGESVWAQNENSQEGGEGFVQHTHTHSHLQPRDHRVPNGWSLHNDPIHGHLYYVHDYLHASVWAEYDGSFPWADFAPDGKLLPVPPPSGGSPVQARCTHTGANDSGAVGTPRPEPSAPPMPPSMLRPDFPLEDGGDNVRRNVDTDERPSTAGVAPSDETSAERDLPSAGGVMVPPVPSSRSGGVRSGTSGSAGQVKGPRTSDPNEDDGQTGVPRGIFEDTSRSRLRQPGNSSSSRSTSQAEMTAMAGGVIPYHYRYANARSVEDLPREMSGISLSHGRQREPTDRASDRRHPRTEKPAPPTQAFETQEEARPPCPPPVSWVTGRIKPGLSGGASSTPPMPGRDTSASPMPPAASLGREVEVVEEAASCSDQHVPALIWKSGPGSIHPMEILQTNGTPSEPPHLHDGMSQEAFLLSSMNSAHPRGVVDDVFARGASQAENALLCGSCATAEVTASAAAKEDYPECSSHVISEPGHVLPEATPPDLAESV